MRLKGNFVLITGGGSGIGLAFAERFLRAGNEVLICGRDEAKLREAQSRLPKLRIRRADLSQASERIALAEWVVREMPQLNVLVNNAGIQRRVALDRPEEWRATSQEIAINLEAPIHLSMLLAGHLSKQKNPVILNVTSGLAFAPLARVPIYCATKAAMRSFTLSLRHQLAKTPLEVIEVIPPAVNTDLGGKGLHTFGAPLDEFADAIFRQLEQGAIEASFGMSEGSARAAREAFEPLFKRMNAE